MSEAKGNPRPSEIRKARLTAGLTQEQSARLVDVTLKTWWQWESGKTPMRLAFWQMFNNRVKGEDHA